MSGVGRGRAAHNPQDEGIENHVNRTSEDNKETTIMKFTQPIMPILATKQTAPDPAGSDLERDVPVGTRNRKGASLLFTSAMLLLAAPALAQRFELPSPRTVLDKVPSRIMLSMPPPFGIGFLECPPTGVLGKYCDVVEAFDTGGFEGYARWRPIVGWKFYLLVAEADQGFPLASPEWEITNGCIDGVSTDGNYIIFDVNDGSTNFDLYCDTVKPNTLAPLCARLEVNDCTHFLGRIFPEDHDIRGGREMVVIRAGR